MIHTLELRRVSGNAGDHNGAFRFLTHSGRKGDTYSTVYLGLSAATCLACGRGVTSCEHISAAKSAVASEAVASSALSEPQRPAVPVEHTTRGESI